MRKIFVLAVAAILVLAGCDIKKVKYDYGYKIVDNQVVYNTPPRPADQQSMLGFACDPIEHVRVGVIGLGDRGKDVPKRFAYIEDATIVALCDLDTAKIARAQRSLVKRGAPRAIAEYTGENGWKELCQREDLDLIYLAVPWQYHTKMAIYAMEHGKHVAVEVPAATSIQECWDLVNTSERTRKHCMMLENCCYDFYELTCLNMAQNGLFGEIVHGEGAYCHNLDPYWDKYHDDWRMTYNRDHAGDVYPTHGIGPVCQALNIHRGDKMDVLVSMQSNAFRGQKIADERYGEGTYEYANGDNTCTIIRTRKGKTILVEHVVTTPRPYNRMYQLSGTEGFANKYPNEGLALNLQNIDAEHYMSTAQRDSIMRLYQHPITSEEGFIERAKKVGGHGGMDYIMDYRLIYCLHHGLPLDQDVYDAAEWSSLVELTEVSIRNGSMPVVMPDFTRGEWNKLDGLKLHLAE